MATTPDIPPASLAAFPGTRFVAEWRLLVWCPRGVMDAALTGSALRWLEAVEPDLGHFNRFVDLSHITEVRLRSAEIAALAERRRERYTGEPATAVFLAGTALAYGMARMYEHLMSDAPIKVHVVALLTSASIALQIPADVLLRQTVQIDVAGR